MKDLSGATGIGSDADYLNGNIVDDQTEIGEHINQDIIQFFQKLKDNAGITENGNFDNETNGYQMIESLFGNVISRTETDVFTDCNGADQRKTGVYFSTGAPSNIPTGASSGDSILLTFENGNNGFQLFMVPGANELYFRYMLATPNYGTWLGLSTNNEEPINNKTIAFTHDFSSGNDTVIHGISNLLTDTRVKSINVIIGGVFNFEGAYLNAAGTVNGIVQITDTTITLIPIAGSYITALGSVNGEIHIAYV